MRRSLYCLSFFALAVPSDGAEPTRVLADDARPDDARLGEPRTLNGYFPFNPPGSREAWNDRRERVREQILVATGLWPLPDKTPLNAVVHGPVERDGYTVEKVYFASRPGHYVTGNLYRPTGAADGKRPGVLCPHGHWANGRFYDAGEGEAKRQIEQGAEKFMSAARHPLQARCVHLARMGCVVFHYDMVGYADSKAIPHREGFTDVRAELWGQNFMGLQTWNSIRALDFLCSLSDVDQERIGVTGASGGGTQTFILCAIDDRPKVAFPAVMVSTAMQGGCVCENCSYLRIDTGNVEFTGLFAPKPLAMSGADDWTIDIESKGLPDLKRLYELFGASDRVTAECFPRFQHNYNAVSRGVMYQWFKEHLIGGDAPVEESDFIPLSVEEMTVFDAAHPRPSDELKAPELRERMTEETTRSLEQWRPDDADSLGKVRDVVSAGLRAMSGGLPEGTTIQVQQFSEREAPGGLKVHTALMVRPDGTALPTAGLIPPNYDETVVIWVHPGGKSSMFREGKPVAGVEVLLKAGAAVFGLDPYDTGELKREQPLPIDDRYAGYTFGYNRPVVANRVHDILTGVRAVETFVQPKTIHLVGWGEAGPWVALARAQCGDRVARTAVDLNQFRFENVRSVDDPMFLPGILKLGGMRSVLAACAPGELLCHNHAGTSTGDWSEVAYSAANAEGNLRREQRQMEATKVAEWLVR